jgi:DNA-binding transcriptional LysR family regulator
MSPPNSDVKPDMTHGPDLNHMIGRLRLRHFDFLDRLSRDLNLGRVAASMNMAQSTATKMLQEIEDAVGTRLFIRNRRGVHATVAGEAMIKRAALILSDMAGGHRELEAIHAGRVGMIRVGVFPVATPELLPRLFIHMHRLHPGTRLSVEEGDEVLLGRRLVQGRIDVVLGRIETDRLTAALGHHVLYHEPTVIVCGAGNPITDRPVGDLMRLMSLSDWVLPTSRGGAFRLVATMLVRAGYPVPNVAVETISALATSSLLAKTDMLGIMPESVSRSFTQLGLLKELPVALSTQDFPVGLIFRRDIGESDLIRQIIETCTEVARQIAPRDPVTLDSSFERP